VKAIATLWGHRSFLEGWDEKNIAKEGYWLDAVKGFHALSWKIADGLGVSNQKSYLDGMNKADATCERHTWSYNYLWTPARAREEGLFAAKLAKEARSRRHYCNAEQEWARIWKTSTTQLREKGSRWANTPHEPQAAAIAFAVAFREVYPSCQLAWNGLSYRRYGNATLLTEQVLEQFEVWAPMCYGNIKAQWPRLDPATSGWDPSIIRCPMVPSGRTERTSEGKYRVTLYFDTLLDLQSRLPQPEVAFWLGGGKTRKETSDPKGKHARVGSKYMLTRGNSNNPPLRELLKRLK
jgi:hypothetical protein